VPSITAEKGKTSDLRLETGTFASISMKGGGRAHPLWKQTCQSAPDLGVERNVVIQSGGGLNFRRYRKKETDSVFERTSS